MAYLYSIHPLKKYLFGLVVFTYVLSVVGIPIYLHYCGGSLEKINYVLKGDSCCGGEEGDTDGTMDCCKDENVFIKNATDFTFRQAGQATFVKAISQLFYLPLSFHTGLAPVVTVVISHTQEAPPPGLHNSLLISTSILRI